MSALGDDSLQARRQVSQYGDADAGASHLHGTYIAQVIAAQPGSAGGGPTGIAPLADLTAVNVGAPGEIRLSDVIAAIEWIVDHREEQNVRVLNLSLRSSVSESYLTNPLFAAVEQAWRAGIVVVASIDGLAPPSAFGYAPANDPLILSVGASETAVSRRQPNRFEASLRLLGSDGPAATILAPSSLPTLEPDRAFPSIAGPSVSAAVVSGIVTLMLDAEPDLTPDAIRDTLGGMSTSNQIATIDAVRAVFGSALPTVAPSRQPTLWAGAEEASFPAYVSTVLAAVAGTGSGAPSASHSEVVTAWRD